MSKTITTPHLVFKARRIRRCFSEHVVCDDRLARDVAQPLFDAGIEIAAITEYQVYTSSGSSTVFNASNVHQISVLLQGAMHMEIPGQTVDLKPGDLTVIPAGTVYKRSSGKAGARWAYVHIADLPEWNPLTKHGGYVRPCQWAALLLILLRSVLDAKASHKPADIARAQDDSRALVSLLRRELLLGELDQSTQAAALHTLIEAVANEPGRDWNRQTMAKWLTLSVSQMTRLFGNKLRISPHELVIRQRMAHATRELVNTDLKIAVIAARLGYGSLHAFTRLFTQHVGMPPGKYRTRFGHVPPRQESRPHPPVEEPEA